MTTPAPAADQDAWLSLVARIGYSAAQRAWPVVAAALARARAESTPIESGHLVGDDPDEGDELVCVDECGFCDACGMEPFGTPAEGWREAARFLRRTPRDSRGYPAALTGARLIEEHLRRQAEEAAAAVVIDHRCAHCGLEVEDRGDPPHEARWVHADWGGMYCYPQQAADSPKATPEVS